MVTFLSRKVELKITLAELMNRGSGVVGFSRCLCPDTGYDSFTVLNCLADCGPF